MSLEIVAEWYKANQELNDAKIREAKLRKQIDDAYFIGAEEGTGSVDMPEGWILKASVKVNRTVDNAAFVNMYDMLKREGVRVDDIVVYKPSLSISEYRKLSEQQLQLFDNCITAKRGTISLELVPPKSKE